jgi:hypothetical protein
VLLVHRKNLTMDFFGYLSVMCLKLTCLYVNLILDLLLHFYLGGISQEKPWNLNLIQ